MESKTRVCFRIPIGSFQEQDWFEATRLLISLHRKPLVHDQNLVLNGFALVDRLYQEKQHWDEQQQQEKQQQDQDQQLDSSSDDSVTGGAGAVVPATTFPLTSDALEAVLMAWRNYVVATITRKENESRQQQKQQQQYAEHQEEEVYPDLLSSNGGNDSMDANGNNNNNNKEEVTFGPLHPNEILKKVRQYTMTPPTDANNKKKNITTITSLFAPSSVFYGIVLYSMARIGQDPTQLEELVQWMEEQSVVIVSLDNDNDDTTTTRRRKNDIKPFQPNSFNYMSILEAWRKRGNIQRCDDLLRNYVARQQQQQQFVESNEWIHNNHHMAQNHDEEESNQSIDNSNPSSSQSSLSFHDMVDVHSFQLVLYAWCGQNQPERAQDILQLMKEHPNLSLLLHSNPQFYAHVIRTWLKWVVQPTRPTTMAKKKKISSVEALNRAEDLFQEMQEVCGVTAVKRPLYKTLMFANCIQNRHERVFELFETMKRIYKENGNDDPELYPDTNLYTTLLVSCAKQGCPEKTSQVLQELVGQLDEITILSNNTLKNDGFDDDGGDSVGDAGNYGSSGGGRNNSSSSAPLGPKWSRAVLEAWKQSNHPNAAEQADQCLTNMSKLAAAASRTTTTTTTQADPTKNVVVDCQPPEAHAFNIVLDAYAKKVPRLSSTTPSRPATSSLKQPVPATSILERMEQLFQQMKENVVHDGNAKEANRFEPNAITYRTMMTVYSRQHEAQRVEELFQELKHRCAAVTCGVCDGGGDGDLFTIRYKDHVLRLQTWSHSGNPGMTKVALKEMLEGYESGTLPHKPGSREFGTVLQAWMRSNLPNAANQAEQGLRRMIELANKQRYDCRPDSYAYAAVISAYARSKTPKAGENAMRVLEELLLLEHLVRDNPIQKKALQPHLFCYTDVVGALFRSMSLSKRQQELRDAAIRRILHDLQGRDVSFWRDQDSLEQKIMQLGSIVSRCDRSVRKKGNHNKTFTMTEFDETLIQEESDMTLSFRMDDDDDESTTDGLMTEFDKVRAAAISTINDQNNQNSNRQ